MQYEFMLQAGDSLSEDLLGVVAALAGRLFQEAELDDLLNN